MIATMSNASGTIALAFTDMPSASEIADRSSCSENRNATATATKNATSMSLWPPPTTWKITIGFSPMIATAKVARSGRTLRTVWATTAIVPMLATAASSWKPVIRLRRLFAVPVSAADIQVNSGPYTDGVPRQPGHVSDHSEFSGKSRGVRTYGLPPYVLTMRP